MSDTEDVGIKAELGMKAELRVEEEEEELEKEVEFDMKDEKEEEELVKEEEAELIDMVLTCQENIDNPNIQQYLETLTQHLEQLVSNAHKVTVKKVEPWNSIRVTLNITREAAEHLRRLAELGDQSLLDLGILSVQVDEDRIVLRTGNGKDSSEIVLTTGRSRPSAQPENGLGATPDGSQGTRTETVTQAVASGAAGCFSSSSATMNQNLESENLKREFDQYMNGLIHGRINCVGGSSASASGGSRNRELSESDWDAMRDALYPNELLSPERHAPRHRHDTSPRAAPPHGVSSYPSAGYQREGSTEMMNDFTHHGGFIGGLNPEQRSCTSASSSWNEVPLTYSDVRHVMNSRLQEFSAGESNSGQPAMMQGAPDGVVAPKKRKRVRKQKALKDAGSSAVESNVKQLVGRVPTGSEVTVNREISRVCNKNEASSLSHNRVTDPHAAGGLTTTTTSPSPLKTSLSKRREPIVNPVTGLLEPDVSWSSERNTEEDSIISSNSVKTEVDGRYYDETMFPLVNLHPPPNPLVALHSRIIANQNQALTSPAVAAAAASAHRLPYPSATAGGGAPRFSPPPHNDAFQRHHHHLTQPSVDKSATGPSPRKRVRSVKTNGTTSQVSGSRSLSNVSSVNQEMLRHPTEWNNEQRTVAVTTHEELLNPPGGGCRASPGASSNNNAISSKKAVERALEMLFDDDDEESMKLDFDLILSKNKNKTTTPTLDNNTCSKSGASPAKKPRKSRKSVVASLPEPGWPPSSLSTGGPPGVSSEHRRSLDEDYTLDGDGMKQRNQYPSSKMNEMNALALSHPPSYTQQQQGQGAPPILGDNFRAMASSYAGAGRLSPFGMSPRLDDRKLLLDYRRIMSEMEASDVHEVLETNFQMTQRNYASILNAMSRERGTTNNGSGGGGLPLSGRPLQHLGRGAGHNVHLREYEGGHFLAHSDPPHRGGDLNNLCPPSELHEECTDDGMPMDLESIRSSDLLTFNTLPVSTEQQQQRSAPSLHPSTDPRQSLSSSSVELSSGVALQRKPSAPRKPRVRKTKVLVSLPGSVDDVINSCAVGPPSDPPLSRTVELGAALSSSSGKELCVNNVASATERTTVNSRDDTSVVVGGDLNTSSENRSGGAQHEHTSGGAGVHDVVSKGEAGGVKTASPPRDLYAWMGSEPDLCGLGTDSGIASNTSLSVGSDLSEPERVSSTDNNVNCGGGGGGVGGGQSPPPSSCDRLSDRACADDNNSSRITSSKANDGCSSDLFNERMTTSHSSHSTNKLPPTAAITSDYSKSLSDVPAKTDETKKTVCAVNKIPGDRVTGSSFDDRETKKYSLGRGAGVVPVTGCRQAVPVSVENRGGLVGGGGEAHRKRQNFRKRQPHLVGSDKGVRLSGSRGGVGGTPTPHPMSQVVSSASPRSVVHSPAAALLASSCNPPPFVASVPSAYSSTAPFIASAASSGRTTLPLTASYSGSPPILASDPNKITLLSNARSLSPPVLVSDHRTKSASAFNTSSGGCNKSSVKTVARSSQSTCNSPRFHRPPSITSPALPRQLSESVQRVMLGAVPPTTTTTTMTLHGASAGSASNKSQGGDVSRTINNSTARQVGSETLTGVERQAAGDGLQAVGESKLGDGTPRVVDGVPRHVDGAPKHVDGAPRHVDGAPRHVDGALRHVDGAPRLVDGAPRHVDGAPRHVDGAPPRHVDSVPPRPVGKSRSSTVLRITKTRSCERDPRSKDQWRVHPVVRAGEGVLRGGGRTEGNTEDTVSTNSLPGETSSSTPRLTPPPTSNDTKEAPHATKHPLGGINVVDLHVSSLPSKQMLNNPTPPPMLHDNTARSSSTNPPPKKSRLEMPRTSPASHLPSNHGPAGDSNLLRPNTTPQLKRSVPPPPPPTSSSQQVLSRRGVDGGLLKEKRRRISSSSTAPGGGGGGVQRLQTKTFLKVVSSSTAVKVGVVLPPPRSNNNSAVAGSAGAALRKVTDAARAETVVTRKRVVNGKKQRTVARTNDDVCGVTKSNVDIRGLTCDSDIIRGLTCDAYKTRDSAAGGSDCNVKGETIAPVGDVNPPVGGGSAVNNETVHQDLKHCSGGLVSDEGNDLRKQTIESEDNNSLAVVCKDVDTSVQLNTRGAGEQSVDTRGTGEQRDNTRGAGEQSNDTQGAGEQCDDASSCVRSSSKMQEVQVNNGPVNSPTVVCNDDSVTSLACLHPDTSSSSSLPPLLSQPATDLEQQQQQHSTLAGVQQQPQELMSSTE